MFVLPAKSNRRRHHVCVHVANLYHLWFTFHVRFAILPAKSNRSVGQQQQQHQQQQRGHRSRGTKPDGHDGAKAEAERVPDLPPRAQQSDVTSLDKSTHQT